MEKRSEFNASLKEAIKGKDQVAVSTIRLILAALKDRDISAKGQGHVDGISEAEILSMLQSMIKQRHDSSKVYRDAGREELAVREEEEVRVIERFLPEQLGDDDVSKVIEGIISDVEASGIKDMGKVMAELKANYAGQVDMGKASGLVKTKLA